MQGTITCPDCGGKTAAPDPGDACHLTFECAQCGEVIQKADGDCCVYRSNGLACHCG